MTQKEFGQTAGYGPDAISAMERGVRQLNWFKSSYSSGEGGDCLEVAYIWRKSSYSDGEGGQCLEVAVTPTPSTSATPRTPPAPAPLPHHLVRLRHRRARDRGPLTRTTRRTRAVLCHGRY